jgi:TatD DNase family protein
LKLFDSHCHLDDEVFTKDIDTVLHRFKIAGGVGIMIAGIDEASCRTAVALANATDICFVSVGVHPHHAAGCSEETLTSLKALAAHPKVRAWGEIGLDYNRMYSPIKGQEKWFVRQIEIADSMDLPIIFHERDTKGRFLQLLKYHTTSNRKGVIHCFSGNRKELEAYLELGLSIGITGIITMKSRGGHLRELVSLIPQNRLLVETDAPWLIPSPERNRHRRNEPAFVRSVLLTLAAVRKEAPEILSEAVFHNACRLFQVQQL